MDDAIPQCYALSMAKRYPLDEFIGTIEWLAEENVESEDGTLSKCDFLHLIAEVLDYVGCADCAICGVDTQATHEYYMVTDELWKQHGVRHGMLCIGCLEQRMGRQLAKKDFATIRMNNPKRERVSERLADRLSR